MGLGFVDPKRMALTGGSYAGYLTAWIVGHDRRFACAWAQRGLYNLLSWYGATDAPQLVRYPREGHEMSRSGEPQHRVDRLNWMVAWFDRYCQNGLR